MAAKDVIRLRLNAAHVRPVDLASALGVTKQQASMMLSGQRGIARKHLQNIAVLLKMNVGQLFTESDLSDHDKGVGFASTTVPATHTQGDSSHAHVATPAAAVPSPVIATIDLATRLLDVSDELRQLALDLARAEGHALGRTFPKRDTRTRKSPRRPAG